MITYLIKRDYQVTDSELEASNSTNLSDVAPQYHEVMKIYFDASCYRV